MSADGQLMTIQKLVNFLIAAFFVALPAYAMLKMSLGVMDKVTAAMWCIPPVAALIAINYRAHLHLLIFALVMPFMLPGLITYRQIHFSAVFSMLVFAGLVARVLMGDRTKHKTDRRIDLAIWGVSFCIMAWLGWNRPGMASIGATSGGAWEAMLAVAAIAAYWGSRGLAGLSPDWKRLVRLVFVATSLSLGWGTMVNIIGGAPVSDIIAGWFWPTGWWFYGLLLGMAIKIWRKRPRMFADLSVYAISSALLLNSLLSGYRSRIIFGPVMVGVALWIGKMRSRMVLLIIFSLFVSLFLANSNLYGRFPSGMMRVLSVVRSQDRNLRYHQNYISGELGRTSPWRAKLWKIGWSHVMKKPVLGHGYAFTSVELTAALASTKNMYEFQMTGVATAGQFHCLPLNLMYYLGIPAALLFIYAWGLALRQLVALATRAKESFGVFSVALLVYSVAATGQALMNGAGEDFIAICLIMGFTQIIRLRDSDGKILDTETRPEHELVVAKTRENEPCV